jgi:hypothetical protein
VTTFLTEKRVRVQNLRPVDEVMLDGGRRWVVRRAWLLDDSRVCVAFGPGWMVTFDRGESVRALSLVAR